MQVVGIDWAQLATIAALAAAAIGIPAAFWALIQIGAWVRQVWRARRDRNSLKDLEGAKLYTKEDIERATAFYVYPDCQSIDPAGQEDFRRVIPTRNSLFDAVDALLRDPSGYKFVILLADSGMGKTSFFLNYYARHRLDRRRREVFDLALVPLNVPNCDAQIVKIANQQANRLNQTVLFLDALDEDRQAIREHNVRLGQLVDLTREFRSVLITCRTQFFPREAEIPTATGVLKLAPVAGGHEKEYYFEKLYLSPFTDEQIDIYLKRRFPLRRFAYRKKARELVNKIPELVARPMLLANIQELVASGKTIEHPYELYGEMVERWLKREKGLVGDTEALRDFSEKLAVDIFSRRAERGMERVPEPELEGLAQSFDVRLERFQLRGRSLLNRDAEGNYKFAHRSIMEYLVAKQAAQGNSQAASEPWTDQIRNFFLEMLSGAAVDLERVDWRSVGRAIGFVRHPKDGLEYVFIPPGEFQMGTVPDGQAYKDEQPRHPVKITEGFWMSLTPVTVAAYKRFVQAKNHEMPAAPAFTPNWEKDDHPVVNVSWAEAKAYCEWASARLPSEAEWEYAARGGKEGLKHPWGNEISHDRANYDRKKGGTTPVGSYEPNGFGLYDMAGNVWEWCEDWFDEGYYSSSPEKDPRGPPGGIGRVLRGGSWFDFAWGLRTSFRAGGVHESRDVYIGFRVVFGTLSLDA